MCEPSLRDHFEDLKAQADQSWLQDPQRSLSLAQQIIDEAQAAGCAEYVALGTMAYADALKLVGNLDEAWETFNRAGDLYLALGNTFGWARTRIGRLGICVEVGKADQALADIPHAQAIFSAAGDHDRNRRLQQNAAAALMDLGQLDAAEQALWSAIGFAREAGDAAKPALAELYCNLAVINIYRGNWTDAQQQLHDALVIFEAYELSLGIARVFHNLMYICSKLGNYREAVALQQRVTATRIDASQQVLELKADLVEFNLALARYHEAITLGELVTNEYQLSGAKLQRANTQIFLAYAYAGQASQQRSYAPHKAVTMFKLAHRTLDDAKQFFEKEALATKVAAVLLGHGQIAMLERNYHAASEAAGAAVALLQTVDAHAMREVAALLKAQAQGKLATDLRGAIDMAQRTNARARRDQNLLMRQQAQYVLGEIYTSAGHSRRARQHYVVSAAITDRLQRNLGFTLAAGSLLKHDGAARALIRLVIDQQPATAFTQIERLKSAAFTRYMLTPASQRWNLEDPAIRKLVDQYNTLRAEYFARNAALEFIGGAQTSELTVAARFDDSGLPLEQRIQTIRDQLYAASASHPVPTQTEIDLADIQAKLGPQDKLLEYFVDEDDVWVIVITPRSVQVRCMKGVLPKVIQAMMLFRDTLSHLHGLKPTAQLATSLVGPTQKILRTLQSALLAPITDLVQPEDKLYIVPFGVLHNIPFNLLFDGTRYVVQDHEIVMLPSAALLLRERVMALPGAHAFHYAAEDDLFAAKQEVALVRSIFGGEQWSGAEATFAQIPTKPTQILHLAMHALHSVDQPEFSYIEFADRRVMTDDLLQTDLRYELVTMSACETGLTRVSGGDEPIGLGRGFLYAGAGAIVSTLWAVDDDVTLEVMKLFYSNLCNGVAKSKALQLAQVALLTESRYPLHPAFWGAFQLLGDPSPLSNHLVNRQTIQ